MLYNSTNRPLQTIVNSKVNTESQYTTDEDIYKDVPFKVEYPEKLRKNVPKEWNPFTNAHSKFLVPTIDQGDCGSCWAFSNAICLSDRLNILCGEKKLDQTLSPNLILICNIFSKYVLGEGKIITGNIDTEINYERSGCYGNHILSGIFYLYFNGTSDMECFPYDVKSIFEYKAEENNLSFYPFVRNQIKDRTKQTNTGAIFTLSSFSSVEIPCAFYIDQDRLPVFSCLNRVNQETNSYGTPFEPYYITYFYTISVEDAQYEIFKNGPFITSFTVFEDFYTFDAKREDAVYIHNPEKNDIVGGHAVEVVGWGTTKKGVPFWWVRNLWGEGYGIKGFFRFYRGANQCNFEINFIGFLPNFSFGKPYANGKKINDILIKRFYLKKTNTKNFLKIFKMTVNRLFQTSTEKVNTEDSFDKDFQKYGLLLLQLYKKIGILSQRQTPNGFDYRSLYNMPHLDYFKSKKSSVPLTIDNTYQKEKNNGIPGFLIFIIVFSIIISMSLLLFLFLKDKK